MSDLHAAVHTAMEAQRERAKHQLQMGWNRDENKALQRMCDWADDVLGRHCCYDENDVWACHICVTRTACHEVRLVAAAFGVETGETQ